MAQEITVHQPMPMADMDRMANAFAKSGLFGVKTPEQALALMLVSQAEGRHPALAARDYDIIQGKPTKKAEAMVRDFQAAGGKIEWHRLDNEMADATFSHESGGKFRCTWDMKRAADAQLSGKEMWKKFPRQMLRSRCVSEGVRTVLPMATSGMYVPEEAHDIGPSEPMRDVTPPRPQRETAALAPAEPQSEAERPMPFAITDSDGDEHLYPKGSEYLTAFQKLFAEATDKDGFWDTNSAHFQEWHTKLIQKAERDGASAADKKAAAAFTEVSRAVVDALASRSAA